MIPYQESKSVNMSPSNSGGGGTSIDDNTTSTTKTWSSSKINSLFYKNGVRNKDLTNAYRNGDLVERISRGDFSDIYTGDYIIGETTNKKCWIADIDSFLHTGDTSLEKHHVVLWYADALSTGKMNNTATSDGGYWSSKGRQTVDTLIQNNFIADFGNNILMFRNLLSTAINGSSYNRNGSASGCSSSWAMKDRYGDLPSEINLLGTIVVSSSLYDTGLQCQQFDICRKMGLYNLIGGHGVWEKDVGSKTQFCRISADGRVSLSAANDTQEFRPFALLGKGE